MGSGVLSAKITHTGFGGWADKGSLFDFIQRRAAEALGPKLLWIDSSRGMKYCHTEVSHGKVQSCNFLG